MLERHYYEPLRADAPAWAGAATAEVPAAVWGAVGALGTQMSVALGGESAGGRLPTLGTQTSVSLGGESAGGRLPTLGTQSLL